ncbi:STAS domain-containing protein [Planosporangium sp. 12N6]|uniref:STAS domain-containing protein n=1 Tax=Planosporangium spinosum TaxID=3402278 RepID=UPI003CF756BA
MDRPTRDPATETDSEPVIVVTVDGALNVAAVRGLGAVVDRALAQRPQRLVIDLSDCTFLDASAIEVLVDAHRRVWRAGGLLTLRHPSPRVRRLLEIARVGHVLHIAPALPPEPEPHVQPTGRPSARSHSAPTGSHG